MRNPSLHATVAKNVLLTRVFQLVLLSLGIASFALPFVATGFRDLEGFFEGTVILPLSAGVALLVLAWTVGGDFKKFGLWLALAAVGQAVTLQLVQVTTDILKYHHYRPLDQILTGTHPLLLAFLVLQTVVVAYCVLTRWRPIWAWTRQSFKLWQLIGIGLVFALPSALVSPGVFGYVSELVLATALQTIQLGTIVLAVWSLPAESTSLLKQKIERLFGPSKADEVEEPGGLDRFAVVCALWVVVLAAVLSFYVYERHPHVADEVGYLYHARYLAEGMLTMPAPPVPEAFGIFLMQVNDGRWYDSMPPGWPAMLAVGVFFGAPWLVNPLLAGLNVLLAYLLLREIYSRRTARIAALLLALSPWYVFLAMSFMNHISALTFALLAALGVAWARRKDQIVWAWLGGAALGAIALIRPLEAVAIAGVLGLWAIGLGGKRLRIPAIAGLVLGSMAVGSAVLAYNNLLTGSPTEFPVMAYFDQQFHPNAHALGFGPDRGVGWSVDPNPGHTPFDAIINANLNTGSMNVELFGWGIGSLLFVGVMVFSGAMRKADYLMLAVVAMIFVPHFFNYFSGGPDFGARYWFLMIIPAVALTARGIQYLEVRLDAAVAGKGLLVLVAVISLSILAVVSFFPWRAADKYHHYLGMRPDIRHLAEEHDFGRSLVLIQGERVPDYSSAAIYNPIDLQADGPVYAWDRSPETRARLLESFPDRPIWIIEGPTVTGAGFNVIEGPLTTSGLEALKDNQ